jgi:hypothetical protein
MTTWWSALRRMLSGSATQPVTSSLELLAMHGRSLRLLLAGTNHSKNKSHQSNLA